MNKVTRYRPAFYEGFGTEINEFETLEELLNISWIKAWESGPDKFHQWSLAGNKLMASYNNGKKWWVVGAIEKPDELDLPKWEPVKE